MKRKFSEQQQRYSNVRDLLTRGIAAAKAGNAEEARFYLEWVLITDAGEDQQIEAWFWLAESSEGAEKRKYLEEILSRRPAHARARRQLAILDGRLQPEEIVDPERLPPRAKEAGSGPVLARQFTCPRCASRMVFTPDGESLHCEHCGYKQRPDQAGEVEETDFVVTMATVRGHLKPVASRTFSCQSCTASFLLAPAALTVTCPYCDQTYAVESAETRELVPPQGIIPFAIDEAQATRLVQRWLEQHQLRPHTAPHGIYLPVWTFDVGGSVEWQGQTVSYDDNTRSWEPLSGSHPIYEDDLLVPASKMLPDELTPLLQSFELDKLIAFDETYLAAWPAQTYEITVGDASLAARKQAYDHGREEVRLSHDGLSHMRFSSAGITIISHKLILLPAWLAQYRHDEHVYMLALNGQTGRLLAQRAPGQGLLGGLERWIDDLLGKE
jgi:transcription elongation factor Elf1